MSRTSGLSGPDVLGFPLLSATVVLAASRARRWSWLVLSGTAAVATGGDPLQVVAGAGLGLAVLSVVLDRRSPVVGAAIGAAAMMALLRLPDAGPRGVSAMVTALAVLPVLVSGYRLSSRSVRRRVRTGALCLGGAAVVMAVVFGVTALSVRGSVDRGIAEARLGLDAARGGRLEESASRLGEAGRSLRVADASLDAWWVRPARLVPLVGPQAHALSKLVAEGAAVAATLSTTARAVNLDDIQLEAGAIELQRIEAAEQPLQRAVAALDRAGSRTTQVRALWLAPPLARSVASFADKIQMAQHTAETSLAAVRVAPAMLGAEGPRRYFVAFTTPVESRGLGGFMGNWAELTAVDGRLALSRFGRTAELNSSPGPRALTGPPDYLARYGRFDPQSHLQDMPYSPDFPTDAQVMEELYPQAGGQPVDGAISLDPYALAALLRFTGPVHLDGLDEPLNADNAAQFLLYDQYLRLPDKAERVDFLDEAAHTIVAKLTNGRLPPPRQLAQVLGPVARQHRLMAHSVHREEQELFSRIGVDGAFPAVGKDDFFSLVTQNSGNSKLDGYIKREVHYRVGMEWKSGSLSARATIRLENAVPESLAGYAIGRTDLNLPPGAARFYVSFYTPHRLTGAQLNGQALVVEEGSELGWAVYSAFVTIHRGETAVLDLDLAGELRDPDAYGLTIANQPLAAVDRVTVEAKLSEGWRFRPSEDFNETGSVATADLQPQSNLALTVPVTPR